MLTTVISKAQISQDQLRKLIRQGIECGEPAIVYALTRAHCTIFAEDVHYVYRVLENIDFDNSERTAVQEFVRAYYLKNSSSDVSSTTTSPALSTPTEEYKSLGPVDKHLLIQRVGNCAMHEWVFPGPLQVLVEAHPRDLAFVTQLQMDACTQSHSILTGQFRFLVENNTISLNDELVQKTASTLSTCLLLLNRFTDHSVFWYHSQSTRDEGCTQEKKQYSIDERNCAADVPDLTSSEAALNGADASCEVMNDYDTWSPVLDDATADPLERVLHRLRECIHFPKSSMRNKVKKSRAEKELENVLWTYDCLAKYYKKRCSDRNSGSSDALEAVYSASTSSTSSSVSSASGERGNAPLLFTAATPRQTMHCRPSFIDSILEHMTRLYLQDRRFVDVSELINCFVYRGRVDLLHSVLEAAVPCNPPAALLSDGTTTPRLPDSIREQRRALCAHLRSGLDPEMLGPHLWKSLQYLILTLDLVDLPVSVLAFGPEANPLAVRRFLIEHDVEHRSQFASNSYERNLYRSYQAELEKYFITLSSTSSSHDLPEQRYPLLPYLTQLDVAILQHSVQALDWGCKAGFLDPERHRKSVVASGALKHGYTLRTFADIACLKSAVLFMSPTALADAFFRVRLSVSRATFFTDVEETWETYVRHGSTSANRLYKLTPIARALLELAALPLLSKIQHVHASRSATNAEKKEEQPFPSWPARELYPAQSSRYTSRSVSEFDIFTSTLTTSTTTATSQSRSSSPSFSAATSSLPLTLPTEQEIYHVLYIAHFTFFLACLVPFPTIAHQVLDLCVYLSQYLRDDAAEAQRQRIIVLTTVSQSPAFIRSSLMRVVGEYATLTQWNKYIDLILEPTGNDLFRFGRYYHIRFPELPRSTKDARTSYTTEAFLSNWWPDFCKANDPATVAKWCILQMAAQSKRVEVLLAVLGACVAYPTHFQSAELVSALERIWELIEMGELG